jgi:hypothetical protein
VEEAEEEVMEERQDNEGEADKKQKKKRKEKKNEKIKDPIQPKEGESVDDWIDRVFVFGDMMVFSDDGSVVVAEVVNLEDEEKGCVSVQFYGYFFSVAI